MSDSTTWPAFNVERRAIAELKPYFNNARTHSKEQVAQIAASMTEWGFTNPILIDEAGMIIAGHGRVEAAKALGVSEVPAIVARGWSEAQKRAYVLADNQLGLNAGWDENLLRLEIGAIKGLDFDIGTIGFGDEFLCDLFATKEGKTEPDDVPEPPVVPVTALGFDFALAPDEGGGALVVGGHEIFNCLDHKSRIGRMLHGLVGFWGRLVGAAANQAGTCPERKQ